MPIVDGKRVNKSINMKKGTISILAGVSPYV